MTKEEQKEYDNAKEDYEELANGMSKQDLIDFYLVVAFSFSLIFFSIF